MAERCISCNHKSPYHSVFCPHGIARTSAERLREHPILTHEEAQHRAAHGDGDVCGPAAPARVADCKPCDACDTLHPYGACPTNYVKPQESRRDDADYRVVGDWVEERRPSGLEDDMEWPIPMDSPLRHRGPTPVELAASFTVERLDQPGNPKDAAGDKKLALDIIPWGAILACEPVFKHGAEKYGPLNWREEGQKIGRRAYLTAALRHLFADLEGESVDPESGELHIKHAIAGLAILLDGIMVGNCLDNRRLPGQAGTVIQLHSNGGAAMRGETGQAA
jgi:hypothetical protein